VCRGGGGRPYSTVGRSDVKGLWNDAVSVVLVQQLLQKVKRYLRQRI